MSVDGGTVDRDSDLTALRARVADLEAQLAAQREADELLPFFTHALDMLCIAGHDGYFKRVNPQWQRVLGYTTEELCAKPFVEFVHPDDRAATIAESQRLGQPGTVTISFENRYLAKDGSYKRILWTASSTAHALYAIARDVTEQRQATEALRDQAALQKAILDTMSDGVLVVDPEGKFIVSNPAAERIFGSVQPEMPETDERLNDTLMLFRSDGVTPYPIAETPMALAMRGTTVDDTEMFCKSPDGSRTVWITANARPIRDDSGRVRGVLSVCRDITARRALEKDLEARTEKLIASEQERTELIARLRHAIDELSTPILELWDDVLAMPVIGVVDSRRGADMVSRILGEVVRTQAQFVILDLTGVDLIDTKTADHFIRLVKTVELTGARCIVTGIRPAVAQTLVDLGVDFGRLGTFRNLKHGLRECLRAADAFGGPVSSSSRRSNGNGGNGGYGGYEPRGEEPEARSQGWR